MRLPHLGSQPTRDGSPDAEFMDTEALLFSTPLYRGLEHPHILVSVGAPGTNPPCIQRDDLAPTPQDSSFRLTGRHVRPEVESAKHRAGEASLAHSKEEPEERKTRFLAPSSQSDNLPASTSIKINQCRKQSAQHISAVFPNAVCVCVCVCLCVFMWGK